MRPIVLGTYKLALLPIQIIEMEEIILKTLEYKITIPSSHAFLVRYLKVRIRAHWKLGSGTCL